MKTKACTSQAMSPSVDDPSPSSSKAGKVHKQSVNSLWNADLLNITFTQDPEVNEDIPPAQDADTVLIADDEVDVAGSSAMKPDDFFLKKRKKLDTFEKKIGDSLDDFKIFSKNILDRKESNSKSPNYNFAMSLLDLIDQKSKAKQKKLKKKLFNICMESSSDEE